jgi:hypothetical protein
MICLTEISMAINLETAEIEELTGRFSSLIAFPGFINPKAKMQMRLEPPSLLTRWSTFENLFYILLIKRPTT